MARLGPITLGVANNADEPFVGSFRLRWFWNAGRPLLGGAGSSTLFADQTTPYYLQQIGLRSTQTNNVFQTTRSGSESASVAGPDLSPAAEQSETLFRFELAGVEYVIPGPDALSSTSDDETEPYGWIPSVAARAIITDLWTAYNAATQAEREAITLTLDDGAPFFADPTGDEIRGNAGTAIAPVTVPEAEASPDSTYAVVGSLPAGIAFDTATRVLSGAPTAVASGTITIRATNTVGTADWTVAYAFTGAVLAAEGGVSFTGDADLTALTPVVLAAEGTVSVSGDADLTATIPPLSLAAWQQPSQTENVVLALLRADNLTTVNNQPRITGLTVLEGEADVNATTNVEQIWRQNNETRINLRHNSGGDQWSTLFGSGGMYPDARFFLQYQTGVYEYAFGGAGGSFLSADNASSEAVAALRGIGLNDTFILAITTPSVAAVLAAEGVVSVSGDADLTAPPPADLAAEGTFGLTGDADLTATPTAPLAAEGTFSVSADADLTALTPVVLAAGGTFRLTGDADLTAAMPGPLQADGTFILAGVAGLTATPTAPLAAEGIFILTGDADLTAPVPVALEADGTFRLMGDANLTVAQAPPPSFAVPVKDVVWVFQVGPDSNGDYQRVTSASRALVYAGVTFRPVVGNPGNIAVAGPAPSMELNYRIPDLRALQLWLDWTGHTPAYFRWLVYDSAGALQPLGPQVSGSIYDPKVGHTIREGSTVELRIEQFAVEVPEDLIWSHEHQQVRFPGDLGFAQLKIAATAKFSWPR